MVRNLRLYSTRLPTNASTHAVRGPHATRTLAPSLGCAPHSTAVASTPRVRRVDTPPHELTADAEVPHRALRSMPDDPALGMQWGLREAGLGVHRGGDAAHDAWDIETGHAAIVLCVIDSGIDVRHPDLHGNLWTNRREQVANGVDDDENGASTRRWTAAAGDSAAPRRPTAFCRRALSTRHAPLYSNSTTVMQAVSMTCTAARS